MIVSEKDISSKFLKSFPSRDFFYFSKVAEDIQKEYRVNHVQSKFGSFSKGSPVALQQSD